MRAAARRKNAALAYLFAIPIASILSPKTLRVVQSLLIPYSQRNIHLKSHFYKETGRIVNLFSGGRVLGKCSLIVGVIFVGLWRVVVIRSKIVELALFLRLENIFRKWLVKKERITMKLLRKAL
ncbi:unnamed protein product [Dracunculus medinensis]|uniref:Uncharacterized protein n=1 Tax=Dracunculus medinensis TaxID=318479 RepID=A0A3P7SB08_DRAME|nr:unnamed protein product [Dracunculus medinensis]